MTEIRFHMLVQQNISICPVEIMFSLFPATGFIFIMANCSRTVADIKRSIQSCHYVNSKETTEFYNRWAHTYEQVSVRNSSSSMSEGDLKGSVCVLLIRNSSSAITEGSVYLQLMDLSSVTGGFWELTHGPLTGYDGDQLQTSTSGCRFPECQLLREA